MEEGTSFEIPDTIHNERYIQNQAYINSLKSLLEKQVALWCVNNMDIINHPWNGKKWITVYYEKMLIDPEKKLKRISRELNIKLKIDENILRKPSRTDFFNEFQANASEQLSKWQHDLSSNDLKKIQDIFDHFGLKSYTARDPLPVN
jgi:hypothetical protein